MNTEALPKLPMPRVLVIDDNPSIHQDFRKILCTRQDGDTRFAKAEAALFGETAAAEVGIRFEIDSAFQGQEGLTRVQRALNEGRPYSMAFVDVRMPPGWDGVETINRIWQVHPELQVVICTAYSDYSWEQIMKQFGHTDSLVILKKPFDNVEVLQLAHAMTTKWQLARQAKEHLEGLDRMVQQRTQELQTANVSLQKEIAERTEIEKRLRLSEERFSKAFQASPIPMAIQTLNEERYVDVNDAFRQTLGFQPQEIIGHTPTELGIWSEAKIHDRMLTLLKELGTVRNWQCQLYTKARELRHCLLSAEMFTLGNEPNVLVIAEDISDRLNLEKRLRHAQKMEAVGQLAAGVAHDFNNILTIIQGHVSLRLAAPNLEQKVADSLQQVASAAERAANLTRQLLAFSAKQVVQPKLLNLNRLVNQMHGMLRRIIGEEITLECDCAEHLPALEADECGVEQIVMNLVVNARDAMPRGGKLTLRTQTVDVDEAYMNRNPEAYAGRFLCLSVVDQGSGMETEIFNRIFEPFFTTKEVGKGTGLGLATVYGIVKQHQGWIEVNSKVGQGSTFRVFLPASDKLVELADQRAPVPANLQGRERVLVVEDETLLRELVCEVLQQHGYDVVQAGNGVEALRCWEEQGGDFEVLVTDVVMPNGMTGHELAEKLKQSKPHLIVIYTSGYSSEMAGKDFVGNDETAFLPKPYKPEALLRMLRDRCERAKSATDSRAAVARAAG